MKSKKNLDHKCRPNNIMVSSFMDRIAKMVSEQSGKNRNNQVSISHGYQILILREAQRRGIDTKTLYDINH